MAFEPTVRTSGYRPRTTKYAGKTSGTGLSTHSFNIFKNLEQDNYARVHRGLTPAPSATANLASVSYRGEPTVSVGLPSAPGVPQLKPSAFGSGESFIDPKAAKNIVDSISESFSRSTFNQNAALGKTSTLGKGAGAGVGAIGGFNTSSAASNRVSSTIIKGTSINN
tara:strand:- start:403 stop:903 length:501 start_codon:yes stop_codon:yes gene_type:complete